MGLQLYDPTGGDSFSQSGAENDGFGFISNDTYTYNVDIGAGETLLIGGNWGYTFADDDPNIISSPYSLQGASPSGFGTFALDSVTGIWSYELDRTTLDANGGNQTIQFTFQNAGANDVDTVFLNITCFAKGTRIATPDGEVPVESLSIGDLIQTASRQYVPVKWIGRQTVSTRLGFTDKLEPVRVRAGALGIGIPHSDLIVSADHGMVIDGLVINASVLVNGSDIDFVPSGELEARFTYYHIETENHDVILANGASAETFIDIPGRMSFDNHQEYLDLYGTERIIPEMDRPRISSKRLLPDDIKARLGIKDELIDIEDFGDLRLRA